MSINKNSYHLDESWWIYLPLIPFLPWEKICQDRPFWRSPKSRDNLQKPTILPQIEPCTSHVLMLIGNKISLFHSNHPHGKQNLIELIKDILKFLIWSKVLWRIHSRKVSKTASHSTSMLVLLRNNLHVSLCCDGLGHLKQGFSHLTIRHDRRID